MKKLHPLLYALVCMTVISCRLHDNNLSISYHNSDHYYSMKAKFSKSKTRDVEAYIDKKIGSKSNMSFANRRIDGTVSLDDQTKFYMEKSPGILKIKLDKDQNSEEAYYMIKSMCEGIKSVVTHHD
jgi:xanthine dehydrogenase molybdopterin-binding subunit B